MTTRFKTLFKRKSSAKKDDSGSETSSLNQAPANAGSLHSLVRQMIFEGSSVQVPKVHKSARVFISSPFRGMEAERAELTQKYFPILKTFCDKNGILFCPVDLRWGITDKAVEEGRLLTVCLQEIERSDIFVGMFGQRYGWHDSETSHTLTTSFTKAQEDYPWVEQYTDRSVTEVEFRHGHLNNPGLIPSFFFFRSKGYDDKMRAENLASGKREDASAYGPESPAAQALLANLKKAVAATSPEALHEDYANPEEGARLIYTELKARIEKMIAQTEKVEAQAPELLDHVRFLKRHALAYDSYIGGEKAFARLDDYMEKNADGVPLLFSGDTGGGKSTLISTWLVNRMIKKPNEIHLFHFVGCCPESYTHRDILFRFVSILKSELNPQGPKASTKVVELMRQFRALLHLASEKKQQVLILVNDLNLITSTSTLPWFPRQLPPHIKIIFTLSSFSPNPGMEEMLLNDFKCLVVKTDPLNEQEKEQLAKQILKSRGKELSTVQMESIFFHKPSANPLYLRVLLDELCAHGDFFTLDKKLASYLQATDIIQLYLKFLERVEEESCSFIPPTEKGSIVSRITSYIYSSAAGVSDLELLNLLGADMTEFLVVSSIMSRYMICRFGLFNFSNGAFAEAVRQKYLPSPEAISKTRHDLIDFFEGQLKEKTNLSRVAQELPFLLWKEHKFDRLKEIITHPLLFKTIIEKNMYGLISFWKDSEASNDEIKEKYWKNLEGLSGSALLDGVFLVTGFLSTAGFYQAVEGLLLEAEKLQEAIDPDSFQIVKIRNQIATNLVDSGKYDQAIEIHLKNFGMEKKLLSGASEEDKPKIETAMGHTHSNVGVAYFKKREYQKAEEHHRTCLEIYKKLNGPNDVTVADTYNNIAVLFFGQKKWTMAEEYLTQSLKIYDEIYLGEPNPSVGGTLLNLAIVKRNLRELDAAEPLYYKAIEHREKTVGRTHPDYAQAVNGLAVFLMNSRNQPELALPLFAENISIFEKVWGRDHMEIAFAHENMAICILNVLENNPSNKKPEATIQTCEYHQKEATNIFLKNNSIHLSFPNIAHRISETYRNMGAFDKALEWINFLFSTYPKEVLKPTNLPQGSSNPPFDEAEVKRNKALVYLFQGKPTNAHSILKEDKFSPAFYSSFYQSVSAHYKTEDQLNIGLEALHLGLQNYPGDTVFLYDLGHANILLKNWAEAKSYFTRLLDVDPKDVDALIGMGECKVRLGEKDVSDLDKALKLLDSNDPRVDRAYALKKEK